METVFENKYPIFPKTQHVDNIEYAMPRYNYLLQELVKEFAYTAQETQNIQLAIPPKNVSIPITIVKVYDLIIYKIYIAIKILFSTARCNHQ
ncbi:unnamed protein product [Paramecium sonneborni]|uniref:Uncharacterized protein n=1 Tax=Paramecium sonneborni TaxID=65129 RepID=A0A8S1KER0_9CILI|nr:unnamed protein product [Paramecium sonneborni]